jgi:hypothetical protein
MHVMHSGKRCSKIPPYDWPNAVGQDIVVPEAQSPNRKDTLPSPEAKMRQKPIEVSQAAGYLY